MLYLNICCAKGSRYFTSPHSSADLDAKRSYIFRYPIDRQKCIFTEVNLLKNGKLSWIPSKIWCEVKKNVTEDPQTGHDTMYTIRVRYNNDNILK